MNNNSGGDLDFIPTKGSAIKKIDKSEFETVVFTSHKPKKKENKEEISKGNVEKEKRNELNIRKAKHEIIKFGMSGLDPEKKQEAKVQLAIKLGAKPPRNPYKNYKVLLQEKAKEKRELQHKVDFQQLGKNTIGKAKVKAKNSNKKLKKGPGGLLNVYGKVKVKV